MRGSAQIFKIFSKSEIFIFKSMRGSAQIFQKFEGPLKFFKFCTESENSRVRSNFSNFALLCEGPLKFFKFCSESENSRVRSNYMKLDKLSPRKYGLFSDTMGTFFTYDRTFFTYDQDFFYIRSGLFLHTIGTFFTYDRDFFHELMNARISVAGVTMTLLR